MKLVKNVLTILALIIAILILTSSNINAKTLTVNTDTLKLRKEASTDSTTIELLNNGEKLEYIEESGDWYKVKVKGMTGYVHKDYIKVVETEEPVKENKIEKPKVEEEPTKPTTEPKQEQQVPEENDKELPVATQMKVSADSNIYILPLINATTIQNIKKDSNVTIISKTNGWYYVETDEVMGWIRENILIDSSAVPDDIPTENNNPEETNKPDTTTTQDEETNTSKDTQITNRIMYVNNSSIYVRKGPSTDTEIVDSLILNATVKVTAENGDWYKVEVDGKEGYIAKRLLSDKQTTTTSRGGNDRTEQNAEQNTAPKQETITTTTSRGQEVVNFAKKYLGCKYVYGASGPNTFDCSGFTMYVLKNFGITLSHSATAQSKVGTYVSKENLMPGDLVFFTDYETGDGIGHCGIYIGDGNFIHASSGTGYCVKISTLTSGSYLKRYNTARRVVQ